MTDLSGTVEPKSNQLNSDDLISGHRTIKITKVSANPSSSEQPVAISFEGDHSKPYYPCKSMRRVLISVWGTDGAKYVGRSLTLYRDPTVTWGGMAVGGIRISHMSDMDKSMTMALTATKQSRKPYTVDPLKVASDEPIDAEAVTIHAKAHADQGREALNAHYKTLSPAQRAVLKPIMDDLQQRCEKADNPPDHEPTEEDAF